MRGGEKIIWSQCSEQSETLAALNNSKTTSALCLNFQLIEDHSWSNPRRRRGSQRKRSFQSSTAQS